jgi:hypothetical protein
MRKITFFFYEKLGNMEEGNQAGKWKDAYIGYCKEKLDNENVTEIIDEEINLDVTWKEVPWDTIRENMAKRVIESSLEIVDDVDRGMIRGKRFGSSYV